MSEQAWIARQQLPPARGWRVSSAYTVTHMTTRDLEQSYPLLYGGAPSATLEKWRQFCARNQREGQKILVVRNACDYVQGLCAYFEIEHLSRGRLLEVPFFLIASAADAQGVADELVRVLTRTCGERGCTAVRISIPPKGWTDPNLLRSGESGDDHAVYFVPAGR
jgi:hypothetical protein